MKKWEYKTVKETASTIYRSHRTVEAYLNHLGDQGWELTSAIHNRFIDQDLGVATYEFYFKREKSAGSVRKKTAPKLSDNRSISM